MVHQAIHIPDIAPNDVMILNDIPRFLTETVNDLTRLLVIPPADDTSAPSRYDTESPSAEWPNCLLFDCLLVDARRIGGRVDQEKCEDFTDTRNSNIPNYVDDDDGEVPRVPDAHDEPVADTYNQYIGAEVTLPIGDKMLSAKVRSRKRALDGSPVGRRANQNQSWTFVLTMLSLPTAKRQRRQNYRPSNVIAQNMYAICDTEGNQFLLQKDRSSPKRRICGPTRRYVRPARIESPLLLNDKGLATLCQMERWKHFMGTTRGLEGV
ncbi:hypothetical protein MHU86_19983 [Fragilaria crotonensis]|nr:hypothetical protein MHU86_19983 [Fragilaria crotonensis]